MHTIFAPSEQEGFFLVNKPAGVPSFRVVSIIRKLTGIRKVGFAGVLDPFASGLMIVAIGRSFTRQIDRFHQFSKEYELRCLFGATTTTLDSDGIVVTNPVPIHLNRKLIEDALVKFRGPILQVPPHFSAKKINGIRAYTLARKGISPVMKPNSVTIHSLDFLNFFPAAYPEAEFRMNCSTGTYVRSLVRDLGEELGTGAYVKSLIRTCIGPFKCLDAINLNVLTAELLSTKRFLSL